MQDVLDALVKIDILCPPREYTRQVLEVICQHFGYRFGVVFARETPETMTVFSSYDLPDRAFTHCTLPCELAESTLRDGHAARFVLPPSSLADPRNAPWVATLQAQHIQTITRMPLRHRGELLGMYDLYATRAWALTPDERLLLAQVAELAGVAIASNQYLGQLRLRTQELQDEVARRQRIEEALRDALRERKALEDIINRSPIVVFLWRAVDGWPVEYASKSLEQFGYAQDELYTGEVSLLSMIHPDDVERVRAELTRITQHAGGNTTTTLDYRLLTRNGEWRWVETRIWPRLDTDRMDLLHVVMEPRGVVTHLQGIMQDISERKRAEQMIRHQAYHDVLTDLPNRVLFYDRLCHALEHAMRRRCKLAVMFLDLDRFKDINDTLGHAIGDRVLQAIAERLRQLLRAEDTVSRLGGDEFTVLLPELTREDEPATVAKKILAVFQPPFHLDGHEIHMSTSIGISLYPDDGHDPQTLLQCADTALYYAKEQGRNSFHFFAPSMHARTKERLLLEHQLRTALAREQLLLYYQPQVDIMTGRITGMEALLRWQHPDLGLVSPAQFIPLAEETGLIESIGQWVIQEACRQNTAWHHAGFTHLTMAVNLSARQFHQHHLPTIIAQALQQADLDPRYLELEITEGAAMRDVAYSIHVMDRLKSMDLRLSMDDFGIGYSSLMCLKQFPINTLKIDQSFIRGLNTDRSDTAIATAIISMARSLELNVIAEGVETVEQLAFLRAYRCDRMQGFLFSRPLPVAEIDQLLASLYTPLAGQY